MDLAFTLAQLQSFISVAKHESMTKAAQDLHVSQSAVSTAVTNLERRLKVQLFVRHPNNSLVLSLSGRSFLREAEELLRHANKLQDSANNLTGSLTGTLVVGAYSPATPFRMPRILAEFESKFPGVEVQFITGDLAEIYQHLLDGDCELAMLYNHDIGGGIASYTIDVISPHVLLSADHPAATRGAPVSLRDFADEPFIKLDLPHSRDYYDRLFNLVGVIPKVRHSFSDYETVRSFVGMGHGFAVLNQNVGCLTYAGASVESLPLTDDLPDIEVTMAWPERSTLSNRAHAFLRVVTNQAGRW